MEVFRYSSPKGGQVEGSWEDKIRQRVIEFTSERDERVKILVNYSFIRVKIKARFGLVKRRSKNG